MKNLNTNQYLQLLLYALCAAKHASEAIIEIYNSDFAVEHKDDKSPLTMADKRSHEIIIKNLKNPVSINNNECAVNNPIFPVLSEEGKDIPYDERKNWEYFWLVDPLDGTKEFIKRNGEFTVNIALIRKNKPVLGCISIPAQDTFYFAALYLGAFKLVHGKNITNDMSVQELTEKSRKLPLNENIVTHKKNILTLIGSRSHATEELSAFVEMEKKKYDRVEFISAGSSLKFCLVAEGRADIYPRHGPTMEWDTAAGQAIVEQTGGKVAEIQTGRPLEYNKKELLNPYFIATRKGI